MPELLKVFLPNGQEKELQKEFPRDPEQRERILISTFHNPSMAQLLFMFPLDGSEIATPLLQSQFAGISGKYMDGHYLDTLYSSGFVSKRSFKGRNMYHLTQAGRNWGIPAAALRLTACVITDQDIYETLGHAQPKATSTQKPHLAGKILQLLNQENQEGLPVNEIYRRLYIGNNLRTTQRTVGYLATSSLVEISEVKHAQKLYTQGNLPLSEFKPPFSRGKPFTLLIIAICQEILNGENPVISTQSVFDMIPQNSRYKIGTNLKHLKHSVRVLLSELSQPDEDRNSYLTKNHARFIHIAPQGLALVRYYFDPISRLARNDLKLIQDLKQTLLPEVARRFSPEYA